MVSPGVLIGDRYRVDAVLGWGGMADVVRATDTVAGRPVALKLLRAVDPADARRFRAELEVLRRLDHPGVVRLCGAGSHDGIPYLVLDLVDGSSLAAALAAGPLGMERSLAVGRQLAEALAHAHRLGVVHRDLKPANVLLDAAGDALLADFGIARLADGTRMTATGLVIGTAPYLAPEQLEGRQVGPAADIYTLALVVLECLTGVRAYPGGPVRAAMARLRNPPAIPHDVPAWLRDVLAAMTATDPGRRPTAEAVAEAFRTRSSEPVLAGTSAAGPVVEPTAPVPVAGARTEGMPTDIRTRAGAAPIRDLARRGPVAVMATAAAILAFLVVAWILATGDSPATEPPVTPAPTPTVVTTVPTTQQPPADGGTGDDGDEGDEPPGNGNGRGTGNGNGNGNSRDGDD